MAISEQIPLRQSIDDEELEDLDREPFIEEQILPLSSKTQPSKRATTFLDGIRGVAAVWAFTHHFIHSDSHFHGFGENGNYMFISFPFIRVFYSGGGAAVSIFFVLSGYVISQSTVKAAKEQRWEKCFNGLQSAIIRRPIRLYLPCFAVTLIIALLMHLPGAFNINNFAGTESTLSAELLRWATMIYKDYNPFYFQPYAEDKFVFARNLWTIPTELQGSILVYVLAGISCRIVSRTWCLGLMILVVFLLQIAWWSSACFIAGLTLTVIDVHSLDQKIIFRRLTPTAKSVMMHVAFIVGAYLLSQPAQNLVWSLDTPGWHYLTGLIPGAYDTNTFFRYWVSYGAILVVYSCLHISWIQWFFDTRPMQYAGKVSYAFYLIQMPIIANVEGIWVRTFGGGPGDRWYDNIIPLPDVGPAYWRPRWMATWTFTLAVAWALAYPVTRYIDEPSVRLGKAVSSRVPPPSDFRRVSLREVKVAFAERRKGWGNRFRH